MSGVDKKRSELVDHKYRPLKKMMNKTSKKIADCVADKQLPPVMLMDEFMAQVKAMLSYLGFGDDRYSAFMAACEALCKAYKEKDHVSFCECFAVVLSLKRECHKRFK